ncbi:hypothetical protein FHG87_000579 [Trinorchestia longiramus]|nr:hypothetical protein FHG87_000579 [Trinorchestia longiramus]
MSVLGVLQYLGPVFQYFAPPALVFYTMKRQQPLCDFFNKRHKDSPGGSNDELNKLREWRAKTRFNDLPADGLDAFAKFLSPDDRHRLNFWRFAPSFDSETLKPYISDGPEMLKDVTEDNDMKEDILRKAEEVSSYITKLRGSMEPDLQGEFSRFQKELDKEINQLTQRKK